VRALIDWTDDERKAVCAAFYKGGESAAQIAARFGTSRNSIIGIAHRHGKRFGFERKGRVTDPGGPAKKGRSPASPRQAPPRPIVPREDWRPPQVAMKKAPPAPVLPPRKVTLAELKKGDCKFAVTPHDAAPDAHLFCGLPAEGSYCPHHQEVCRGRAL
jgi:hypothetical protein